MNLKLATVLLLPALNPQYANAYNNRGVAYQAIGKSAEAERDFAKAKELGYVE